jgi:hypothetical protein
VQQEGGLDAVLAVLVPDLLFGRAPVRRRNGRRAAGAAQQSGQEQQAQSQRAPSG